MLLFCSAQDYNQTISHIILSQIFDTVKNAYSILSDQYTDYSSYFLLIVAGIDQEETESSGLKKRSSI